MPYREQIPSIPLRGKHRKQLSADRGTELAADGHKGVVDVAGYGIHPDDRSQGYQRRQQSLFDQVLT